MAAITEDIVIQLQARTESVEQQIAKLTEQLGKAKNEAKKVSEDGLERMIKNGGAMGILNDLTGGLAMQFKDAYESIQLTNTGLKGMKAALLATGIGAAVVLVGALVANWDKITKWIRSSNEELKTQLEYAKQNTIAAEKSLEAVTNSENILRLQGMSEKEIILYKQTQLNLAIRQLEKEVELAQELQERLNIEQWSTNRIAEKLGVVGGLYKMIFDNQEEVTQKQEELNKQEDKLLSLKNQEAGIQLSLKQIEEDRRKANIANAQKAKTDEAEILKEREKNEIEKIDRVTQAQSDARQKRIDEEKQAEFEIALSKLKTVETNDAEVERIRQKNRQRETDEAAYKEHLTTSGFALAGQLNDLLFTKQGKQSRDGFRVAKALGIAEAGVNTYKAASAAYATASASPYAIINPGYPAIMAGVAVAFGLAQIAKIASAKYEGGAPSGGGGGGGNIPGGGGGGQAPSPTNPQAAIDFSFLNQQKPAQTYVIAGDVTSAQEADQKIKDQSVL